nr:hypothetical protein [Tanacetum cinerariifolium]
LLYFEVEHGALSAKKPVIVESYNESVFPTLQTKVFAHVINHLSVIVPRLPSTLNLPHDILRQISYIFELAEARQQVSESFLG